MRSQYTEQLIQRAERDDEFRALLKSDPRAAVSQELGIEIPGALEVKVIEEDLAQVILVLPAQSRPGELREEELAGVAGGSASYCGHTHCSADCNCTPPY
jgi:hypothetical protein